MVTWRDLFSKNGSKVEYRVCSENISWRSANNFMNLKAALFENDGAYNMFHSYSGLRVEEQREKYGTPYFCAAWSDDEDTDTAILVNEAEVTLVPKSVLVDISTTSVRNYLKWDQKKKFEARITAQRTRELLVRVFQESTQRVALSHEEIDKLEVSIIDSRLKQALDLRSSESTTDIVDEILTVLDSHPKKTEALALAKSRVGQGTFRAGLIEYWGACSVTGCQSVRLLKASHIKPWALSTDEERLDVYNGLLLVPGIDLAFDLGLITFLPDGKGVLSDELSVNDRIYLGIYRSDLQLTKLSEHHAVYLRFHNRNVFESWKRI